MAADKDFFTLNELADSGLLHWKNIASVRKQVDMHSDIFQPKYRGEGRSKRYVIYRKNVEEFIRLWNKGELKGMRRLGGDYEDVRRRSFMTIAAIEEYSDKAKRLRESAEKIGYRVDYLSVKTRTDLMRILSGTVKTHPVLIFIVKAKGKKVWFPDNSIASTDVRRVHTNSGTKGKVLLVWSNEELSQNFKKAFLEKGKAGWVRTFVDSSPRGVKELSEVSLVLEQLLKDYAAISNPINLLKKKTLLKKKG